MTTPSVLIPFRAAGAKSRLSPVLSPRGRAELCELMLLDVLGALRHAGLAEACSVVSPDEGVLSLAAGAGANAIREPRAAGVNSAVRRGMSAGPSAESFMVVPSDVPTLRPGEVKHALQVHGEGFGVISPSRGFDGTNLLLFTRRRPIPLSYDADSFWNHVAGAARAAAPLYVYSAPGLVLDVDTPPDLAALARSGSRARAAEFARRVVG